MRKKEYIYLQKLIFTAIIFFVYLFGKNIPLYGIDLQEILDQELLAEKLLINTVSGDLYRYSILTLGVFPYMISSMLVQVFFSFMSEEERKSVSQTKKTRLGMNLTLVIAMMQAFINIANLPFKEEYAGLMFTNIIVFCEMVAGSMFIVLLCSYNKRYGIGGQTVLIVTNILNSILATIKGIEKENLLFPVIIALVVMFITLFMENTEFRIPLQRISIHNIYADKNYMAIKFNPVGVLPSMFATTVFILPQLIIAILLKFFPDNSICIWFQERLSLSEPMGICVYISIVYLLAIGFSFLLIHPSDVTEQFLKSGDSLVNIHVGEDTRKYLSKTIILISIFSATITSICLAIPLVLQIYGKIDESLSMLPTSIMMLTGIWCSLLRESKAIRDIEGYHPFI